MSVQIQLRRDVAAAWTLADPVLADGEVGLETDTLRFKIGDGATAWSSLPYRGVDGAPGGTLYSVDVALGSVPRDSVTTTFAHVGATTLQRVLVSPAPASAVDDELEMEPLVVAAMVPSNDVIRLTVACARAGGLVSGTRRFVYTIA